MAQRRPPLPELIVAGGGPAGLAAAFRLQEAGHRVRVLEASERAGSKLSSGERDGFLLDRGAFFIPTTHRNFLRLAEDAGIADELVPGGFGFGIARSGEIHQLDGNRLARDFLRSGVISTRAKLGAAKLGVEAVRARRATVDRIEEAGRYDTESLASWAERSLNPELAGYVIDPAIRAIYATEGDAVSRVELLGMLALFGGAKLVAFREGMAVYADRLAQQLDVVTGASVLEVRPVTDGAEVTWRDSAASERSETVDGVIVALPAQLASGVLPELDPWRREYLERVRRGRLVITTLALSAAPAGIDATYTMIPRAEHPFLTGIVCDHNKAPGRTPAGKGLLTLALSEPWCEEHTDDDDESLIDTSIEAVERFMPGTASNVEFAEVSRWRQQYCPVGHYAGLREFRARSAGDGTVRLAGEYLSAPHLSAATAAGERAAAELGKALA